jgi:hypothetical protein
MKKLNGLMLVLFLLVVLSSSKSGAAEISSQHVAGSPDPPMKIDQEPNPLLLGHWGCLHTTTVVKTGEKFKEPIEYWLVRKGDQYGLYFFRNKRGGMKKYRGWRGWTLAGDRILTEVGVSIFVKDGEVYYEWKNDPATRMSRLE